MEDSFYRRSQRTQRFRAARLRSRPASTLGRAAAYTVFQDSLKQKAAKAAKDRPSAITTLRREPISTARGWKLERFQRFAFLTLRQRCAAKTETRRPTEIRRPHPLASFATFCSTLPVCLSQQGHSCEASRPRPPRKV